MFRRFLVASVVVLALVSTATAVSPATARTNKAVFTHTLIVSAQRKLAVLVLISQNGGPPAGAVATPTKPLTVHLDNRGLYRVKAEIDTSCKGTCNASYRISGSANHKLTVVPSCQPNGTGFVCSRAKIVKIY
jgi:hypothetical protein